MISYFAGLTGHSTTFSGIRLPELGTKGTQMTISTLVLAAVNAPHSKQLDAQALVFCLKNPAAAETMPGHMSAFFGEVDTYLQKEFAHQFGISDAELVASAKAFSSYSGEHYPIAA